MSREIKFRAWDKWRKEMIEPHEGDFIRWHAPSNWKECYEVMQYTGLKDRNGKEIYEGDIMLWEHDGMWTHTEVKFEDGMFQIDGAPLADHLDEKVVGNIYEKE